MASDIEELKKKLLLPSLYSCYVEIHKTTAKQWAETVESLQAERDALALEVARLREAAK